MKTLFTIFLLIFTHLIFSQNTISNFWVEFTDKENTPYSIFEPQTYLSPRAIARRQRLHIPIDTSDLPVDPIYLEGVKKTGAIIRHTSKWLNSATILTTDSIADLLSTLPYIKAVERVGRFHEPRLKEENIRQEEETGYKKLEEFYGYGALQIGMVNGHALHRLGHWGEEVYVGVQDGGFDNVDIMPFFDSLRINNRILPGKDFVDGDDYIYESAAHGTSVLSVMASNLPYLFVGTAPHATYMCLKTEDVRSETLTEECNWVAALEYADSVGIDVINSSLGYTRFSDTLMNYEYADLNGQTSRASRAADIAFSKGIFVVNSAGNSGAGDWRFVGTPADSKEIFSIGAVTPYLQRARFSSFGPTADGRIKPNIAAMGQGTVVAALRGYEIGSSSGTSLSSPLIAGLVASLKAAFPTKSNRELRTAIEQSASQASKPDNVLGYGIPDFYKAYQLLNGKQWATSDFLDIYAMEEELKVVFLEPISPQSQLRILDWSGRLLFEQNVSEKQQFEQATLEYNLPKGVYYVVLEQQGIQKHTFFVKIKNSFKKD